MANEGINTALEILNQMFGREWQSREADKERAHKLMSMRIQSDENELQALNRRIERESDEVRRLETEHAKLTGFLKERGESGTQDARQLAAQKLGFYEAKRSDKKNQLSELNKRAQELNVSMANFINMRDGIASGLYEKFVGVDKDKSLIGLSHMSPEERKAAIDHQRSLDQNVDVKLLDAALSQYASGASKEQFDMLYRQGMYNLAVRENERKKLEQAAGETQAMMEQSASQFKAEWSQFSSRLKNSKWAIGDDMAEKMSIPDVNATAKSVVGALDSMALNVAELVSKYADENPWLPIDWLDDVTPEVKAAIDRYGETVDREERTRAAYQILREVRGLPDLSQFEDEANQKQINYLSDMLSGVDMLMNAQRYLPAYATSDEDAALLNMRLEELSTTSETETQTVNKPLAAHNQDVTESGSMAGDALSLLNELATTPKRDRGKLDTFLGMDVTYTSPEKTMKIYSDLLSPSEESRKKMGSYAASQNNDTWRSRNTKLNDNWVDIPSSEEFSKAGNNIVSSAKDVLNALLPSQPKPTIEMSKRKIEDQVASPKKNENKQVVKRNENKQVVKRQEEATKKEVSAALEVIDKLNKKNEKKPLTNNDVAEMEKAINKLANPVSGGTVNKAVISYITAGNSSPIGFTDTLYVFNQIASGLTSDIRATHTFVKNYLESPKSKGKKNLDRVKTLEKLLAKLISRK